MGDFIANGIGEFRIWLLNRLGIGFGPWRGGYYPHYAWNAVFKCIPIGLQKQEIGFNLYLLRPTEPFFVRGDR